MVITNIMYQSKFLTLLDWLPLNQVILTYTAYRYQMKGSCLM